MDDISLIEFVGYYLRKYMESTIPAFHKEMYDLVNENRLIIAAPRKFAKSTIFSFFYPLFCSLTGRKKDILVISRTGALAEDWLRKIKTELEGNEDLIHDFGELVNPAKWTEDYVILRNGVTIRAKGWGYQIRGFHPDLVVGDDLEDDESVNSELQTEVLTEWFYRALINSIEMKDQLIVIGTILNDRAFLNELLAKKDWTTRKYSCWVDENKTISAWPDKWPVKALLARKEEIGSYRFAAEYENEPISKAGRRFFPEWFRWYEELPDTPLHRFMTVDPAVDEKGKDYSAFIICSVTNDWKIYVEVAKRIKASPLTLIDTIFDLAKEYQPTKIGIEQVCFQKVLQTFLKKESVQRRQYLPIVELKTDTHTKKEMRIESLSPRFERGEIYIKRYMTELTDELLRFPSAKNDDLIDALAYQTQIIFPPRPTGTSMLGNLRTQGRDQYTAY